MGGEAGDRLSLTELEEALRATDPSVRLIAPRILRRVIKRKRGLTFLSLNPRLRTCVVSSTFLRTVVEGDELGIGPGEPWPDTLVLVARPSAEELAVTRRQELLRTYWDLHYRAQIVAALRTRGGAGPLSDRDVRERIERIGRVEFAEVRAVLRQEGYLPPPRDDRNTYEQFAAVFSGLRHFAPTLLPVFFAAIEHASRIEEILSEDFDGNALLAATRPEGAGDLRPFAAHEEGTDQTSDAAAPAVAEPEQPRGRVARMLRLAKWAGGRGNLVRSAIVRWHAANHSRPHLAQTLRETALAELDRLAARLQNALGLDEAEAERWRRALPPLLRRSAFGFWTPEARLLYDLQKACLDHERPAFRLDLLGWLASRGRRPLRHPLPHLRVVLIANHLRRASRRLPAVKLARDDRTRLSHVLHRAAAHAEVELRDEFRPLFEATLEANGIRAHTLPGRVARHKLIEELLDGIVGRGFLTIGDLRDACSRSHLKLPDLAGPADFLSGDRLLRTDRALAVACEGVYRRGEVYLRALQRLSALAFATPLGRLFTLYVALPYGGAFITLEGLQHIIGPILHYTAHVELELMTTASWLVLGTVALGLINFPRFRVLFLRFMKHVGRSIHSTLVTLAETLLTLPLIRRILDSHVFLIAWRFLLKPLIAFVPLWALGLMLGLQLSRAKLPGLILFGLVSVLINTRVGRDFEEILTEGAARTARQLFLDTLPGMFRLIMEFFGRVHEGVERLLYAVDEWLRFRAGQTRAMIVAKAILGLGWFVIAYLVRIYVNLLIEPQVNPIKHFPVVTVSHKLMIFYLKKITILLAAQLMFLGKILANFIAGTTVLLLPGVFGFLVWELKENWKLYEANRSARLGPVIVGQHGETMARMLRPGFHSGTLPKLFAKLRKSEQRLVRRGTERAALRHRESLHHVEEEIRRFVERNLLVLMKESRSLGPLGISLGTIDVATNRVRIALRYPDVEERLVISFELRGSQLVGRLSQTAWAERLSEARQRALTTALSGLFTLAGVELVPQTDVPAKTNGRPKRSEVMNSLDSSSPTDLSATPDEREERLIPFQPVVAEWSRWVESWELDQKGAHIPKRIAGDLGLVPRAELPTENPRRRRASRRRR